MKISRASLMFAFLFVFEIGFTALSSAQAPWHIEKTLQIGGQGGMDYLTVDSSTHRLYVPRSTHTQVINAATGTVIGDIPGQKNAHGVALVPKLGRGFITDGGGKGAIVIFDLTTNATLGVLEAVPDADGIIYDPGTDLILVSAGDSNCLLAFKPSIDPKNGTVGTPIELGGAPEFLAADGTGRVYVNLENKDTVAVVDLNKRKTINHWSVSPGGAPVGMSLDRGHHNLIIGCRKPQKMIIMSTADGKVVASLPIGSGVDATATHQGESFASCGDGSLIVVDSSSPNKFTVKETIKTLRGAKTLGIDTSAHKIYLPTANFEDAKPGTKGRPPVIPGTFKILVLSR